MRFEALTARWWVLLLRGVVAILFGLLALAWPGITLLAFIFLFGAFALMDGVLALVAMGTLGSSVPRWWLLLIGIAGIAAAGATYLYPGVTGLLLLSFIAGWAIARGMGEIAGAIEMRKQIRNEWTLVVSGLVSVAFGFFVIVRPGDGALAVVRFVGAYAMIVGALLIGFSLRLRGHRPNGDWTI